MNKEDKIRCIREFSFFEEGDYGFIQEVQRNNYGIVYRLQEKNGSNIVSIDQDDFKQFFEPLGTIISTGSLRFNSDKPSCHHIAPGFITALADLMTESAKKYSRWNYAKGQPYTIPYDSLMRHLHSFMDGEDTDKESGKSHLIHIAANAMIMWVTQQYQIKKHPELDDRFKKTLEIE